eukprot:scaffold3374_cov387-Prasinococcus_capsulatus_cf.AAC.2
MHNEYREREQPQKTLKLGGALNLYTLKNDSHSASQATDALFAECNSLWSRVFSWPMSSESWRSLGTVSRQGTSARALDGVALTPSTGASNKAES